MLAYSIYILHVSQVRMRVLEYAVRVCVPPFVPHSSVIRLGFVLYTNTLVATHKYSRPHRIVASSTLMIITVCECVFVLPSNRFHYYWGEKGVYMRCYIQHPGWPICEAVWLCVCVNTFNVFGCAACASVCPPAKMAYILECHGLAHWLWLQHKGPQRV